MLGVLPTALHALITALLWSKENDNPPAQLRFQLRHQHAISNDSHIVFADIPPSFTAAAYPIISRNVKAYRPESLNAFMNARTRSIRNMQSEPLVWHDEDVIAPDIEKRDALLQLAKMTYNSYAKPSDKDWYEVGTGWNASHPFGWEPDADGLRGHVFATEDNSTVVISIKGTSAGWLVGGGGPTVTKDRLNDNLLFSCCCARVGPTWSTVCGCHSGGYRCDQICLENSLVEEGLFYPMGISLYNNVSYMYPDANIWLTGHSLGGGLASLIGVTFGAPVVAFEAPGERLAAKRLHLPSPPSTHHVTHVYHTGDPIPAGACTGVTSTCALGGYALETGCHLGKIIRYDTVSKLNWSVSVRTHGIKVVIDEVLKEDWDPENGREVPVAEEEVDCVDCFSWEFGEFQNITRG